MLGNETDTRLLVDGKPNSNFMRIRFLGRDWSIFGTWDSLLKAVILVGTRNPQRVLRQMPSAFTRLSWDFISGETAIGERTRDSSLQIAYTLMKAFMPFVADETIDTGKRLASGDVIGGAVTFLGAFTGAKSSALGFKDTQDVVANEKFQVDYDELYRSEKREVGDDERVKKLLGKLEEREPPADERAVTSRAFDNLKRLYTAYEVGSTELGIVGLREKIEAGSTREALREAIQEFKTLRYRTAQVLLSDTIVQDSLKKDTKQPVLDALAEEYWSAPAPIDPASNVLDFDFRDDLRAIILQRAADLNLSRDYREYITGTGKGTYRGDRFDDEVVRDAVEEFESDMAIIRPYYAVTAEMAEKHGLFELYQDFRKSQNKPGFREENQHIGTLLKMASIRREDMRETDADLDRLLWKWGFIEHPLNPIVKAEVDFLQSRQGRSDNAGD